MINKILIIVSLMTCITKQSLSQDYFTNSILAVQLCNEGKYLEAGNLILETLPIVKQEFGENDTVNYLPFMDFAFRSFKNAGDNQKAIQLGSLIKEIYTRYYDKNSIFYSDVVYDLGYLYFENRRYKESKLSFEEALEIFRKIYGEKSYKYVSNLHILPTVYFKLGEYSKSLNAFQAILQEQKEILGPYDLNYEITLLGLSQLYDLIAKTTENQSEISIYQKKAISLLLEAYDIEKEVYHDSITYNKGMILENLAELSRKLHKYNEAGEYYKLAIENQKVTKGFLDNRFISLVNDAGVFFMEELNDFQNSETYLKVAIGLYRLKSDSLDINYAESLNNIGVLYFKKNNYDSAEFYIKSSLKIKELIYGKESNEYVRSLKNAIHFYMNYKNMGQIEPYLSSFDNLMKIVTSKNYLLLENFEKKSFYSEIDDAILLINSLYMMMVEDNPKIAVNIANDLLFYKSLLLRSFNELRKAITGTNQPIYTDLLENLNHLYLRKSTLLSNNKIVMKSTNVAWSSTNGEHDNLFEFYDSTYSDTLATIEFEIDRLSHKLSDLYSNSNPLKNLQEISWETIRQKVNTDEIAVDFFIYGQINNGLISSKRYAALVIDKKSHYPAIIKLVSEDSLNSILNKTIQQQRYNAEANVQKRGMKRIISGEYANDSILYSCLWKPLNRFLAGKKTIYYSPIGLLNVISLDAIKLPDHECVVDKFLLIRMLNLLAIGDPISDNTFSSAMLYGGVRYDMNISEMLTKASLFKNISNNQANSNKSLPKNTNIQEPFNYLPGTLEEVNKISEIMIQKKVKVNKLVGENANEESFKNLVQNLNPSIIHLATHGFNNNFNSATEDINYQLQRFVSKFAFFYDSEYPLQRCGLLFAGSNNAWNDIVIPEGIDDGILTAEEISRLDLRNTQLVVLSACQTGKGQIIGNEGVYGLQRAFKLSGVRYIMMTLWDIPDNTTIEFMTMFYSTLFNGESINNSFKNAQLWMRMNDSINWAAFVLLM